MNDKGSREEARARKKGHGWVALVLAVVLGVTVFAAYRDGTGFDALRRYLSYGKAEEASAALRYEYDASPAHRFGALGNTLVVLSETSLELLDGQGNRPWAVGVKFTAPALHVHGGKAVAYDVGGHFLYVVDEAGEVFTLESEDRILSARLNAQGWLAVTAEAQNYKGTVSVYDEVSYASGEPRFVFQSSRRFVVDGYVTDDGKALAAVTLGQRESEFVTDVVLYHLNEEESYADLIIPGALAVAIGEDRSLITVTDSALSIASYQGEEIALVPFEGLHLREYAYGGAGFTALLLSRYTSGNVATLMTIGREGETIGRLDINEEVLSISAAGRYLAVLYASRLVVYNEELQVYAALNGTDYAGTVLMRSDGTALLLGGEEGTLFLP